MTRLNQILAIEKQTKTKAHEEITRMHHNLQKLQLLSGISRTYEPLTEDGEKFPPERNLVQLRAQETIADMRKVMTPLYDITLQRDVANTEAKADVVVDGKTILKDIPATYLLWLEKQVTDMITFAGKLPALPQDDSWSFDEKTDCYRSDPTQTAKTKKIPKPFIKAEATKEHPAQVDVVHEDVVQGYWTTQKFSGALKATDIRQMKERAEELLKAIKFAREQANTVEIKKVQAGESVLNYIFGK